MSNNSSGKDGGVRSVEVSRLFIADTVQGQHNMKILEMRIDFNEFYQRKEEEERNKDNADDGAGDADMYGSEDDDDDGSNDDGEDDDYGDEEHKTGFNGRR